MRGQAVPLGMGSKADYYTQLYKQAEKKDVPLALVIVAGVFIWVLIFGSVVAFALIAPCSFTKALIGQETFEKFRNPALRTPPCDPARDPTCVVWKLDNNNDCGCFLRYTVIGKGCPGYLE
ncbi:MAG: hypothetical protein V1820_05140 [archaeon]